jgi:hypothetical protein
MSYKHEHHSLERSSCDGQARCFAKVAQCVHQISLMAEIRETNIRNCGYWLLI